MFFFIVAFNFLLEFYGENYLLQNFIYYYFFFLQIVPFIGMATNNEKESAENNSTISDLTSQFERPSCSTYVTGLFFVLRVMNHNLYESEVI